MYKHIDVGSWDFGMKTAEVIPVSSRGLTASDSNLFFTKRAGEHQFKEILDKIALAKDEIPVHLIAMGCTEKYAANKNSDGFREVMLKEYHPTFVKNARVYYDHKAKDPKKAFGKVASSLYNNDMGRVELLILLNGSKEAAVKNGGLVAPDEDIERLKSGKELPWSMGISVPFDRCSGCGNDAKTLKDYCEEHECIDKNGKQRFGCKSGLGKTAEDGFVQYVDNPRGTFKDISRVSTPADRTAYGAIAKYAAESGHTLGGAQLALARGYVEPLEEKFIKTANLSVFSETLSKLASIESTLKPSASMLSQSLGFRNTDDLDAQIVRHAHTLTERGKCAELMHLADFDIVLGPKQFAKFAGYSVSPAYTSAVSGMFGQLDIADEQRYGLLDTCTKYAGIRFHAVPPYFHLYKESNFYNARGEHDRYFESLNYKPSTEKTASANDNDYKVAIEYCLYKIAAVTRMNKDINYVTAVIQNYY